MSGDEQPDPRPKERSHAGMTLGEAIDWALNGELTDAELAEARALMAKLDAIAEQNRGADLPSRVMFRS